MYQLKDRYVHGQEHNTRSITLIKNVQSQINSAATRYRSNCEALLSLSSSLNKSGWKSTLQVLADSDLHGLKEGEDTSSSEGQQTLSWIWVTQQENEAEMTESMSEVAIALQIEWCKSRSRAHRWQEEAQWLQIEERGSGIKVPVINYLMGPIQRQQRNYPNVGNEVVSCAMTRSKTTQGWEGKLSHML
ncbi:hypothetical protein BDN71DRAFT_1436394 [Pleurotus eryngii]|uniref:Uncharacterized protein n=1 Tax=Pleurotus eryngii TaxID=5323 RepID=A0A9P5ZJ84_PLEER|nr:hypothetical protein BDN71DRAFT_1436394 [Pleurotus eryngii]